MIVSVIGVQSVKIKKIRCPSQVSKCVEFALDYKLDFQLIIAVALRI